jgi:hypothetical protein
MESKVGQNIQFFKNGYGPYAAIIIEINSIDNIDLIYFPPHGKWYVERNIPTYDTYTQTKGQTYWRFLE